ncbi:MULTISPECIES: GNAT family N-acetyltransferase [unclassified Mesorhizobium]|uniref:GNAT family N-acetyltransferase n=1 Tax=unclassified Mesorhizobium TaxID=325217 RepID=UPI000F75ABBD|nr:MULTISPECIES: GNAT family N-acetyltransferase [unclassified Mesorhizobium]AZO03350.1 GNAT family N-acetyltransferase [Mesorhizobium sp. M2A.F.Ca.ET.043.02.1.1]RUW40712.1 GNAT family N-acetyltransferase [Mesorhizobium sp. M2A.F.Ca.ET.015.02.1.1]RUW71655.1 GNAT family N-acetyltransferase [Mesorhizobium sp. M2A.F.Ca.ET.067.02.1.1]RVC88933.1 GNAT family N-acetyltransferase [Mesorhizobium sp. M2A.F.Ca.ET.017.03.2.1]RVD01875.1 GNAT family N-acetyltransferase [Mesorhizobium sp. M2A.F.Ca.ET.029.05.
MAAVPLLEETSGGPAGAMVSNLAGLAREVDPAHIELFASNRPERKLAIYPASAGFDLVEELDYLSARTVEPNVFFNPRFLAPAMPRLEDREVRLAVIRDGDEYRNRLRLLVPFSVERPAIPLGVPVMRTWSSPFGPLGTPLVDRDDPIGVIEDFFSMLSRPHLKLPKVFVLPDMRLDGPVASLLTSFADSRGLTLVTTGKLERPVLESDADGEDYLKASLRAHHYREFRRLKRRLADLGKLEHVVARGPDEIRHAIESFLTLEAAGWKGRERTAMAIDRYRAAFAREAVHRLAEQDMCRIHVLTLDGRAIACLVVFVEAGVAYTWKTAYDETLSAYSPGTLLMIEVTKQHLDDPNIVMTDSCAVPDHPVMSRLWSERKPMGTLVIGLTPDADRLARQAASQLHLYRETRNMARLLRNRMRSFLKRR